jgi:hypothetical protein
VPIAVTPDQLAVHASIRDWAKQAGPVAAVRRLAQARPDPYLSDPGIDIRPLREITGRTMGLPR